MFSIFDDIRQGNEMKVRLWLDNTENDPNLSDDHRFSLLHWAAKSGNLSIVEMLLERGARINVMNMGDDTPLHLAAAHNHRAVLKFLVNNRAMVDAVNEHGNTPLHYACFWNYQDAAEDLLNAGASVIVENQFGDTPLDKARPRLCHLLQQQAQRLGRDVENREPFRESWSQGTVRTRSRDPTLSREAAVDVKQLRLRKRLCINHGGEVWSGEFKETEVIVKVLRLRACTTRHIRDFNEECPRLRIFNHANILPLVASLATPPNLIILTPTMEFGSLHNVLHHGGAMPTQEDTLVVDTQRTLLFALDIARGMDFLHCPELKVASFALNSKHVMIDEDLTAKLNMGDVKFSFHEKHREYNPAWVSPESLRFRPSAINKQAADMWSFGIILWELETREEPFSELSPMEVGLRIVTENLRVKFPPGMSKQKQTLIKICTNESPGKRPKFDQIMPILEKMKKN